MRKKFDKKELEKAFREFEIAGSAFTEKELGVFKPFLTSAPNRILYNGTSYGEVYGEMNLKGRNFDYKSLLFYRTTDENIQCALIGHDKGYDVWTNFHDISIHGQYIAELNKAIYGEYDRSHTRELALMAFMAEHDVLLLENDTHQILANSAGIEFATIEKVGPNKVFHYQLFYPYEIFRLDDENIVKFCRNIQTRLSKLRAAAQTKDLIRATEIYNAYSDPDIKWFVDNAIRIDGYIFTIFSDYVDKNYLKYEDKTSKQNPQGL